MNKQNERKEWWWEVQGEKNKIRNKRRTLHGLMTVCHELRNMSHQILDTWGPKITTHTNRNHSYRRVENDF